MSIKTASDADLRRFIDFAYSIEAEYDGNDYDALASKVREAEEELKRREQNEQ